MSEQAEEYELFRRAIEGCDADAWAEVHARYRLLLSSWANRYTACGNIAERADDIADQALARAWAALTPERFAEFPTLAKLMSYLRACVATTAIDYLRAQTAGERALDRIEVISGATPEQIVLADLDRSALWSALLALAPAPAERIVLVESFAYGLPPRAIYARHQQLFTNVAAVYVMKRNLCARLKRNRDLLQLDQLQPRQQLEVLRQTLGVAHPRL